jgi:hypothetical protein
MQNNTRYCRCSSESDSGTLESQDSWRLLFPCGFAIKFLRVSTTKQSSTVSGKLELGPSVLRARGVLCGELLEAREDRSSMNVAANTRLDRDIAQKKAVW